MSHKPRSYERVVKAATIERRDRKAQERQPQKPVKPHQISKLDKGLKNY